MTGGKKRKNPRGHAKIREYLGGGNYRRFFFKKITLN